VVAIWPFQESQWYLIQKILFYFWL